MQPPNFFNPLNIGIELVYTIVILVFCLLVYIKTREIYELSKHKGIRFFRYSFIFFALAYASRLFLYLMIFDNDNVLGLFINRRAMMPVSNLVAGFFSTMAILYLTYSTIWKKINIEHFMAFSNIIALFIAVIAFVSRSPLIVSLIQLVMMVFAAAIILKNNRKYKKKYKKRFGTRALYLLIFAFWLISLFALQSRRFIPFEVKAVFQLVSIAVFIAIYYKVAKWIK